MLQILHFMGTKFRPLPRPPFSGPPCFPPLPADFAPLGVEVTMDFCNLVLLFRGIFKLPGGLFGVDCEATMSAVPEVRQLRQRLT